MVLRTYVHGFSVDGPSALAMRASERARSSGRRVARAHRGGVAADALHAPRRSGGSAVTAVARPARARAGGRRGALSGAGRRPVADGAPKTPAAHGIAGIHKRKTTERRPRMFYPFKDDQGRPKTLPEVSYADLDQLRDLEEGYALEFKRSFSPTVQRKVPKIVASFANSAGGWLVIGIADDDRSVCPVPRLAADYSQIIGELCRRHITPAPRIDVRFIADPADPTVGVVVVQVLEGDFPPYISDGVVHVREGSTSGPAASTALVDLYGKATRRRAEVTAFCRRTVFVAARETPLFNLYMFRMGRRAADVPSRDELNAHAEAMRGSFARQGLACRVHHAHDSLIFSIPTRDTPRTPHSSIELFGDESLKLTVPAVLLAGEERKRAAERLFGAEAARLPEGDLHILSAEDTLARVTRMAAVLDRYVRERGIAWRQYAVAYELENLAGAVLWSDEPLYLRYARERGPLFCATADCLSRVRYLDDGAHDSFRARQFAGSHFFEACGLPLGSPDENDNALVDALLRT